MNSGQICMSTERVIVQESIADEFLQKLTERMKSIRAGNHLEDPSVDISGLISPASAQRCVKMCKEAVDDGAKLLLGDLQAAGTIMQPHILDNVRPPMRAFVEESFGPSKHIARADILTVTVKDIDTKLTTMGMQCLQWLLLLGLRMMRRQSMW